MQFENKFKVCQSFTHLIDEQAVIQYDCITITDGHDIEQMIFLGKTENEFEVRIYKANPTDTYVPNQLDFNVKRYEANDEFASFFFDRFFFARRFISLLRDIHPEYNLRPIPETK